MLFSATQTTKVADLARISLRAGPLYINVDSDKAASTAEFLEQGYLVCESDKRFLLLFTFLKRHAKKKIIVFFSSCNSVKYYSELLNYIDVPVLDLHVSHSPAICPEVPLNNPLIRASKSNKSVPTPSSNSATPRQATSSAQMSPLEASTFPKSTGSSNSILLMIRVTTSTESDGPPEPASRARVCCSCCRASKVSCNSWRPLRFR